MGEDGDEGDETPMDGLGGKVEDGVESGGLRGILGELEWSRGVGVAVGQTGQLDGKSSTVLELAFLVRRGDVTLQFVDAGLEIAVDVFQWAGDRGEFARPVVADHFQHAIEEIPQDVAELVE